MRPRSALEPALEHLERARILRRVPAPEPDATGRREIYHDVLAPAIRDWRRRHHDERTERDLARARERARRLEVRNRRLAAAVVALLVVGVALALYVLDPGTGAAARPRHGGRPVLLPSNAPRRSPAHADRGG